ncbi:Molybdopterin synthase sulfur carrier subunit [bacterium HR15]|nr:Molybdopterin synthase sulfur carrier subunit [bacterium HR15]
MTVCVLIFAHLKSVLGADALTLSQPEGATVRDLLHQLQEVYPALTPWLESTRVAVNREYATLDTLLHHGDEVALIPPVSGG